MKRNKLLFTLGIFSFIYWVLDFINIVFFINKPEFVLWYSSAGLLLTSIALIRQSPRLILVMFCSLFVMESIWSLDFLARLLSGISPLGITDYLFEFPYTKKDLVMTMYHLMIPPFLLIGVSKTQKIFHYSWIGSVLYAGSLAFLTYWMADPKGSVNCIHQLIRCRGVFSSIFTAFPKPYHIFFVLLSATFLVYLPTNYLLNKIGKKFRWREI